MGVDDTVARAKGLFESLFGSPVEVGGIAPGRVNLIGEHTDYCEGFVFPLALEHCTVVAGRKRPDGEKKAVVVSEAQNNDKVEFEIGIDMKPGEPSWSNYIRGMVSIYGDNGFDVPGFDAVVCTDVPIGGGVSSSAAFEMASGLFLEQLCGKSVDKATRALWGQKCEHTFVGLMCGIMDQMISSKAEEGSALVIDCRSLEGTPAPMADPDVCVLVCNSNIKHELTGSEYPERVEACKTVAKALGVDALRDGTMDKLDAVKDKLSDTEYRRGRHVITEDERVIEARDALFSKDYAKFGSLMAASHASLRDDYEVSIPAIDYLVDTANAFPGVYGSRITGGGFGGCTVTLLQASAVDPLIASLSAGYKDKFEVDISCFVTKPGAGARPM